MRRTLAVGVLCALLLLPIAAATAGPFTSTPDGLAALRALGEEGGHEVGTTQSTPLVLAGQEDRTLLVIAAPHRGYTDGERQMLHDFVASGGRLLVADDLGPGGDLGALFGLQYDRLPVYGANGSSERSRSLVEAAGTIGGTTHNLVLDLATPVSVVPGVGDDLRRLARTSQDAFVDLNGDERIDRGDLTGAVDVAYGLPGVEPGTFEAVFLGDSSLLMNQGLERGDNRAFVEATLDALLPEQGRIVFDVSAHAGPVQRTGLLPLTTLVILTTDQPFRTVTGLALVAGVLVAALRLRGEDAWGAHRFDPDIVRSRPGGDTMDADKVREMLLEELGPTLRAAATDGLEGRKRLDHAVDDPKLAAFLAGEHPTSSPEELRELVQAFDAWLHRDASGGRDA